MDPIIHSKYRWVEMDRHIYKWMDGCMDGWMNGWMHGWMHGWMDGWMDGLMDGWTLMNK